MAMEPRIAKRISSEFTNWFKTNIKGTSSFKFINWFKRNSLKNNLDVVLSPAEGSRIWAYGIVRTFNLSMRSRTAYALSDDKGDVLPELTNGSRIKECENVLIVSDLIEPNDDIKNLEIILKNHKANMLGILAIASQNEESRIMLNEVCERNQVPYHTLINLDWNSYGPNECPHGDVNHIDSSEAGEKVITILTKEAKLMLEKYESTT